MGELRNDQVSTVCIQKKPHCFAQIKNELYFSLRDSLAKKKIF